jgi:hypothetical protein
MERYKGCTKEQKTAVYLDFGRQRQQEAIVIEPKIFRFSSMDSAPTDRLRYSTTGSSL